MKTIQGQRWRETFARQRSGSGTLLARGREKNVKWGIAMEFHYSFFFFLSAWENEAFIFCHSDVVSAEKILLFLVKIRPLCESVVCSQKVAGENMLNVACLVVMSVSTRLTLVYLVKLLSLRQLWAKWMIHSFSLTWFVECIFLLYWSLYKRIC